MSDILPIDLDVERVVFDEGPNATWEIAIETTNYGTLYHYTDRPDGMYDQMCEQGVVDL